MIALVAMLALSQLDGGTAAPFTPVVLDVAYGMVWEHSVDGGVSDVPTEVVEGVYMDNATTMWVGREKARTRGERSVGSEPAPRTVLLAGTVMFVIGVVVGAAVVGAVVLTTGK